MCVQYIFIYTGHYFALILVGTAISLILQHRNACLCVLMCACGCRNKPCMQLVLWKPAPSLLIPEPDVTRDTNGENKSEREQADSMEACVR